MIVAAWAFSNENLGSFHCRDYDTVYCGVAQRDALTRAPTGPKSGDSRVAIAKYRLLPSVRGSMNMNMNRRARRRTDEEERSERNVHRPRCTPRASVAGMGSSGGGGSGAPTDDEGQHSQRTRQVLGNTLRHRVGDDAWPRRVRQGPASLRGGRSIVTNGSPTPAPCTRTRVSPRSVVSIVLWSAGRYLAIGSVSALRGYARRPHISPRTSVVKRTAVPNAEKITVRSPFSDPSARRSAKREFRTGTHAWQRRSPPRIASSRAKAGTARP